MGVSWGGANVYTSEHPDVLDSVKNEKLKYFLNT